jgi:hypothetical protein
MAEIPNSFSQNFKMKEGFKMAFSYFQVIAWPIINKLILDLKKHVVLHFTWSILDKFKMESKLNDQKDLQSQIN